MPSSSQIPRILLYASVVVIFLSMLFMGALPKLWEDSPWASEAVTAEMERMWVEDFGLPLWFRTVIGVLELVAAILVLIPAVRYWGSLLAGFIMLAAAVYNIRIGMPEFLAVNLIIMGATGVVQWYTQKHAERFWPFR